jgi:hypothetical protein
MVVGDDPEEFEKRPLETPLHDDAQMSLRGEVGLSSNSLSS